MPKYIYKYTIKSGPHWRVNVPGHDPQLFKLDDLEAAEKYRDELLESAPTKPVAAKKSSPGKPKSVKKSKRKLSIGDRISAPGFDGEMVTGVVSELYSAQFVYKVEGSGISRFCFYNDNWKYVTE